MVRQPQQQNAITIQPPTSPQTQQQQSPSQQQTVTASLLRQNSFQTQKFELLTKSGQLTTGQARPQILTATAGGNEIVNGE